jgi:hypothetical protein
MKPKMNKYHSLIKTTLAVVAAVVTLLAASAHATLPSNTAGFHGGNWSSWVGLTTNIIQYPAGIDSGTTPAQAAAVADAVACDYKAIGINFVRYPINPATISGNWAVTTNAISELLAQGLKVDICCWYIDDDATGYTGTGKIPNMTTWKSMWQTVDAVYGNNGNVYYEPINEPYGYSPESSLASVYTTFFGYGLAKPKDHMILDCGFDSVASISDLAADASLNGCFLTFHYYASANFSGNTTESGWISHLQNEMGTQANANRTIMTEAGAVTTTGLYYGATSTDSNICFVRGLCTLSSATWPMGFCWFPSHQHLAVNPSLSNPKRLFNNPGAGAINPSLIIQLQRGWDLSTSWHAWDNPAGGSGFTTAFAACSWGSLREDVFGVKTDGNIYHTWWFNNSGWNTLEEHQCPVVPAGGPAASANNGVAGEEDIYYIGVNGNLYHQYYSGGWQPSINTWDNLGAPAGVTLVGSPTATSWGAGRYDVYARGSIPTHIYHAWSTNGITYSWQDNGGAVTNDVAICSWGTNRLDAFSLGVGSGAIWHQYWNGAWNPSQTTWAQTTPETNAEYALGACSWGDGRIDLFGVTGSTIGHVNYDTTAWHGDWTETHTPPATPISAPCATSWGVNRIDAFVLGSDGKCYHLYWGL